MMEKKPFYKKWWGMLLIIVVVIGVIGAIIGDDESSNKINKNNDVEKSESEMEDKNNREDHKEPPTNNENEEVNIDEDANEFVIDKEFKKNFGKARKVRNDVTGNWRIVVTSAKFDVEEMLIPYHDYFMKEDEIHFIVSFATNTTTVIRNSGGIITSEVHEYVDKEEHDAKTLGRGMVLAEYMAVDGVIEQINADE